jgi:hypothetical protein
MIAVDWIAIVAVVFGATAASLLNPIDGICRRLLETQGNAPECCGQWRSTPAQLQQVYSIQSMRYAGGREKLREIPLSIAGNGGRFQRNRSEFAQPNRHAVVRNPAKFPKEPIVSASPTLLREAQRSGFLLES